MAHSEARMAKKDLAFATVESYRKILESAWRPCNRRAIFEEVTYSTLAKIVDASLLLVRRRPTDLEAPAVVTPPTIGACTVRLQCLYA